MNEGKVCDNCKHATNHEKVTHEHGWFIKVDCTAPIPGFAHCDDKTKYKINHKAAEYCQCHEAI